MRRSVFAAVAGLLFAPTTAHLENVDCMAVRQPGCAHSQSLVHPQAVTVAPDGRHAYVAGYARGTSTVAAVALGHRLRLRGCWTDGPRRHASCKRARIGEVAIGVAVSPDGRDVYSASFADSRIGAFTRRKDGSLRFRGSIRVAGVDGPTALAVSPDGRDVYVTSFRGDGIAWLERTGDRLGRGGCISVSGGNGCGHGRALRGALGLAIADDGRRVYVAARRSGAVAVFARDARGDLHQLTGERGCISSGPARGCADVRGLGGASNVAVSGEDVWVTSEGDGAVVLLHESDRTWHETGCLGRPGSGCAPAAGIGRAVSVAPVSGGAAAVVASEQSRRLGPGGIAVVRRLASGGLAQDPGACMSPADDRCERLAAVGGADTVATLSDGDFLVGAQQAQALVWLRLTK